MDEKELIPQKNDNTRELDPKAEAKNIQIGKFYEDFFHEFTRAAGDFVGIELQEKLRHTKLLVGGCGSIGSPVVTTGVRSGMEDIVFADPDVVEQSNLARQDYTYAQVGINKAEALRQNIKNINPYPEFKAVQEGITDKNVEELVKNSDILFDGIDIRASDMMYKFHEYAAKYRKPVIVGYDLAGTAMLAVYRYDKKEMPPLNGDISPETMDQFKMVKNAYKEGRISEGQFLDYVNHTLSGAINPFQVPVEQFEQLINKKEGETRTPQMGTTSRLIGALAIETIKQIISGKEVKDVIAVDLPTAVRKLNPSVLRKVGLMLKTLDTIKDRGKEVDMMLHNLSNQNTNVQ